MDLEQRDYARGGGILEQRCNSRKKADKGQPAVLTHMVSEHTSSNQHQLNWSDWSEQVLTDSPRQEAAPQDQTVVI